MGAPRNLIGGFWGFEMAERRSVSGRWSQTCIKTVLEAFGIHVGCVFGFLGRSLALLEVFLEDLGASWMDFGWLNEGLAQHTGSHTCIEIVLEAFGIHLGCVSGLLGKTWGRFEALVKDLGAFWMDLK